MCVKIKEQLKTWLAVKLDQAKLNELFGEEYTSNQLKENNLYNTEIVGKNEFGKVKNQHVGMYRSFLKKNNFKSSKFNQEKETETIQEINFDIYLTDAKIGKVPYFLLNPTDTQKEKTLLLDDDQSQHLEHSLEELSVFYSTLETTLESKKTLSTSHPMTPLLKILKTSYFAGSLQIMQKTLEVFQNSDFMDIRGILRSPGLVHEYVRKCEKLESLAAEKGRKISEKRKTISESEEEKRGLERQKRAVIGKLVAVRADIQKELEANFKARFLVVN